MTSCAYCEYYRTSTKRYVRQVGEIVKHSRLCFEVNKVVNSITNSCPGFVLARHVWCEEARHWVSLQQLCFHKPCKQRCLIVAELIEFKEEKKLKRIPGCIKTRKYPKVANSSKGGNGKRIKPSGLTALDAALDASNVHSYLSTSADEYELVSLLTPLDVLLRKEQLKKSLSKEAAGVVQLIFSSPEKVCSALTGNITKGSLATYLRGDGWAHKVIAETFRELKTVTASF